MLPENRSQGAGADFVDISAEFRCTARVQLGNREYPHEGSNFVHCVVGTNLWFIEGDLANNADIKLLFTGTNVIEYIVLNQGLAAGKKWTNTWLSNGAVPREADVANLPWLAFCSGPYLKRIPVIPLPAPSAYFLDEASYDHRKVFNDELELPSNIQCFLPRRSADDSRILYWPSARYDVLESTNFLGWTFPLRFEVMQSAGPGGGNGFGLYDGVELTIGGQVTSIKQGRKPAFPVVPR